jgi:hypothetical protein
LKWVKRAQHHAYALPFSSVAKKSSLSMTQEEVQAKPQTKSIQRKLLLIQLVKDAWTPDHKMARQVDAKISKDNLIKEDKSKNSKETEGWILSYSLPNSKQ